MTLRIFSIWYSINYVDFHLVVRSLGFIYYINCYLKENLEKKYNCNVNMNFFWWWFMEIIIRPSIPHGCAAWIPSSNASIASLASWQYKVAKLILDTNMKIPRSALFLELGWEPIKQWLSRHIEGFLLKIKKLPITRLCKLVLMEVEYSTTSSGW